ncbi:MAG: AGE family epimerase/isomerase [Deltaproteobacteria bacterium]|nr:AGE family epimerase/isomerase [Deltaproteobacteria bacterium]
MLQKSAENRSREGNPIRKRRYIFTETFAAIAYAALYKATGEKQFDQRARDLFQLIVRHITTPGLIPSKFTNYRPMRGLAVPMIMIITAQELQKNLNDHSYTKYIDQYIYEIRNDFMKQNFKTVLETVGPHGEFIDHFDGRLITPGHAIEAAWFIMNEAIYRDMDRDLLDMGLTMLDWMWKLGWDDKYGGILYFRDAKGLPVQEYWQDMKFWWPHNETIIATLIAYSLTENKKYQKWHKMVHDWTYDHFPDPEYGEWFGYLHRDGSISVPLKGNLWKGPFHIPRMQLNAWKLAESLKSGSETNITSKKTPI